MDDQLRALHRIWTQTHDTADGIAYYRAALRSGQMINLEELAEIFPSGALGQIALHNPHSLLLGGRTVADILTGVCQPVANNMPGPEHQPLFAALCQVRGLVPGQLVYRIYYFTVTRSQLSCPSCGTRGPHFCTDFQHPSADGGWILAPSQHIEYDDPLYAEAAEADITIRRHWYPSQTERQMGDIYRYEIQQFIFENALPNNRPFILPAASFQIENWYYIGYHAVVRLDDPNMEDIAKVYPQIATRINQQYGTYANRTPQFCLTLLNNIEKLLVPGAHGPLEEPPTLERGPCEDFRIIPGGQVMWSFDASGSRVCQDNTTVCGHGYIKGQPVIPLCPPYWSDGEQAGWKCNSCGKLLGMAAGKPDGFVLCRPCGLSVRLEREAEQGGRVRVKHQRFRCPCRSWYEILEEAAECCGEAEEDIEVVEEWGWDDGDDY